MAKAGISLDFEAYSRRDPVNGATKTFLRNKHARQSSPRLKAFQRCVRQQLEGHTYRGGDPATNSAQVRAGLSAAARSCARGGGRG